MKKTKKKTKRRQVEDAELTDTVSMRDLTVTDAKTIATVMVPDTAQDTDGAMVDLDQEAGNQRERLSRKERRSALMPGNRPKAQKATKES
jgi:hypothetical protein